MKQRRHERPSTYAARTYASPYWIVRYSHQQRFKVAGESVGTADPATLLDYGCGDGHFLIGLLEYGILSPQTRIVAFEPIYDVAELLRANLAESQCADRVEVVTDIRVLRDTRFDCIACMGVLEHLPLLPRFAFYDFLQEALTTEGFALIDVPVEIGPSVLVKEFGRRVLKRDPPDYAVGELLRIAAGGAVFDPKRFNPDESDVICRHQGFDHRILLREIEQHFTIVDSTPTPLPRLPSWLGNQELILTLRRNPATVA